VPCLTGGLTVSLTMATTAAIFKRRGGWLVQRLVHRVCALEIWRSEGVG
jgi:hypothetical protein